MAVEEDAEIGRIEIAGLGGVEQAFRLAGDDTVENGFVVERFDDRSCFRFDQAGRHKGMAHMRRPGGLKRRGRQIKRRRARRLGGRRPHIAEIAHIEQQRAGPPRAQQRRLRAHVLEARQRQTAGGVQINGDHGDEVAAGVFEDALQARIFDRRRQVRMGQGH